MNKKNSIKIWKSNYIELFGLPGAGKTYVQNKIINRLKKNNLQVLNQKELIIKFYLKNQSKQISFFLTKVNLKLVILTST